MTLVCPICQGPINSWEPTVMTDAGRAHRFKVTCEKTIEDTNEFEKHCGIVIEEAKKL